MADVKKLYDDVIMDHIKHARNYREISAATGQAVGGSTTSCAGLFRIFLNAAFKKEVKGEQFRALEKQWENVTLLIVDEVSLIGRAFFHRMHCRLHRLSGVLCRKRSRSGEIVRSRQHLHDPCWRRPQAHQPCRKTITRPQHALERV